MRMRLSVVCACGFITIMAGQAQDKGLDSLANAERAFAKLSVQTSQREAFLANFADDGIWFDPGPSNTRAALTKAAAPSNVPKRTLDWEPVTGDIALSGDLGYTTGPYTASEGGKPVAQGWFFSVWKKSPDGPWRVIADFGIPASSVGALRPQEFRAADVHGVSPAGRVNEDAAKAELALAERDFTERASREGLLAAYRAGGTEDLRLYRPDSAPLVGRIAIGASMPSPPSRLDWSPAHIGMSAAGDLAYTYGAYTSNAEVGGLGARGFYLHVWKRRPEGWRLAVDVTNVAKQP